MVLSAYLKTAAESRSVKNGVNCQLSGRENERRGPDADLGSGRENAAVGTICPIRLRADQSGILIGALGRWPQKAQGLQGVAGTERGAHRRRGRDRGSDSEREGFEPMAVGREDGKTVVGGPWLELFREGRLRGVYGRHARRRPWMKPFAPFVAKSGRVAGADGSARLGVVPWDRGILPR